MAEQQQAEPQGTFSRIANEVLQATDRIATSMEEGISLIAKSMTEGSDSGSEGNDGGVGEEGGEFDGSADGADGINMSEEEILNTFGRSPLNDMADGVLKDIMATSAKPETFMENVEAFRSAITWSEPFIISLIAFQVLMFFTALVICRKNTNMYARISFLFFVGALVRSSEYINNYMAKNYTEYGITQNYFDPHGIFMSLSLSAPLMIDCLLVLILFVREAAHLLVEVKTMELKKKIGKKTGKKKEGNPKKSSKQKKEN